MTTPTITFDLAKQAKALSDTLWNVNTRADAVRWCSEADQVLQEIVRTFNAHDCEWKADPANSFGTVCSICGERIPF